jgi:hypothetical protein
MITAIVRYRLPSQIGEAECRAHYERIAPGFGEAPGLLRKQFIWSERGIAGGVYQWTDLALAERFYAGPWLDGIRRRYGVEPEIEFFKTLAITDNPGGVVTVPDETPADASARLRTQFDEFVAAKLVPLARRTG